jgi:mannosyltransferase OCH1-like enzyme
VKNNKTIPKVIHYCWFGKKPLPDNVLKCINSWKTHLPDYKIIQWNEENFDLKTNQFVYEAYNSKKYAFVTDFVRLEILYSFGGIYMDTDVEILKNIDSFLYNEAFSGFETETKIPTAIMASLPKNRWIKLLLDYYANIPFLNKDGSFNTRTNVDIITEITTKNFPVILNNKYQLIDNTFALYPSDFFCPKSYKTGKIYLTKNSHAIHHFNGSWLSKEEENKRRLNYTFSFIFGKKIGISLSTLFMSIKKIGINNTLQKIFSRISKK